MLNLSANLFVPTDRAQQARAIAPATCGELIQGVLGDRDFLINSPINLYSEVEVQLVPSTGEVKVATPGVYSKLKQAVGVALKLCAPYQGARVVLHSHVARGKGLASSTSEITAAVAATAAAAGAELSVDKISDIAIGVEPSDGVYYPGVIMYDQIRGQLLNTLGKPPPIKFIVVDSGGEVDTLKFERGRFRRNALAHQSEMREALRKVVLGFKHGSAALVAEGATKSALCNQAVLYKPELDYLLKGTQELGGLGVNCAHTGTVLGVMFNPYDSSEERLVERVGELVGAHKILGTYRLISGGATIL